MSPIDRFPDQVWKVLVSILGLLRFFLHEIWCPEWNTEFQKLSDQSVVLLNDASSCRCLDAVLFMGELCEGHKTARSVTPVFNSGVADLASFSPLGSDVCIFWICLLTAEQNYVRRRTA